MEPLHICVFYFLQVNLTQVSTEPINKDLRNTEASNQETISSKNTEDFSGQISTDSGIEITTFRSLKDASTVYFLQVNTTFSNIPTSSFLPRNTEWTTKSIQSNNEELSPTISSIDLQGDLVFITCAKVCPLHMKGPLERLYPYWFMYRKSIHNIVLRHHRVQKHLSKYVLGPFNNYIDKMRGSKNICFCPRSGYKNCPRKGGGGLKNGKILSR